jgi:dipeptidyl aminopeptidase/acylaminoacyl peptidase
MRHPGHLLLVMTSVACACAKPGPAPAPPTSARGQPAPTSSSVAPIEAKAPTSDPDAPTGAAAARDRELAEKASAFIDVFVNTEPVFSRDGKRIIFLSDRDGLPQLYVADARPDAPATRIAKTDERMSSPVATRDGKSVIFRSDRGGDENWSFFKVDLDGTNLIELTPGERLRRDFAALPEGKPDTLFYTARKSSDPSSSAFMQPLSGGGHPKKIYEEPGFGLLAHVSSDGKWGAWMRIRARTDSTALLVDVASGTSKVVYPTDGQGAINGMVFSADAKRLYVATDGGGDRPMVLAFDTRTLKEVARHVEAKPGWIDHPVLASRKGNLVGINVLAGDHFEARLLDATTLVPKVDVKTPLGSGALHGFSDDGRRATLGWSTAEAPDDAYAVDVQTGAVAPLRSDRRPSLQGLPGVETRIVTIPSHDDLPIRTNVYLPAGASGRKLPVIVSFHGGPAAMSVVEWDALARFFLGLGYAWIAPNVRGSQGFGRAYETADNGPKRLDAFRDVETVGRWAGTQPWADKDKIIAWGGSYGGYTTLIALTRQPELWAAGVDLFGIVNLRTFFETTTGLIRQLFKTEYGDFEKEGAMLDALSPIHDVGKISAPLFVYAGANDPRVPRAESDQVVKALRARGVPVEYMVAENEGHSLDRRENRVALYARAARFLETHLAAK